MKREREETADTEGAAVRHCPGLMAHVNGSSTTVSQLHPDSRNNKYDRQLRIWGEHGQLALEQAHVCLVNCGPTGTEAMKNLVLGGIGRVTVLDPCLVHESDLGNNFLLRAEDLGQPRAKCVAALLREMNDSVVIEHVEASHSELLQTDQEFFAKFTLIIATQMRESSLVLLDEICRRNSVMLLVASSYGLAGYVRVSVKEHAVVDSKPDHTLDDLRLVSPWPELIKLAEEFDLETRDSLVHKHIPFGIILIKVCEEWKSKHDGKLPSSTSEKAQFRELLASKKIIEDEENFAEAVAFSRKMWSPPTMPPELKSVLDDRATEVDSNSSDFWILAAALKRFLACEGGGELPLDGAIPDMHSFTEYYIQLQKCYQAKAEADVTAVEAHVRTILKQVGRDLATISRAAVKQFCKNAGHLKVLRYSSLSEEYTSRFGTTLQKFLPFEGENFNYAVYILFRAVDKFAATFNRYPGLVEDELDTDVSKLKTVASGLVSELGLDGAAVSDDLIYEFCRFGAGQVHCVGAVVGGIASQEAIKLVTRQFTPVQGPVVYNAINSTTTVLQL